MLRLMTSFLIFSIVGCSSVQRPDSLVWGVNAPAMWLEGYNIHTDYDDSGVLKPGAVKKFHPFTSVKELNAAIIILPPGHVKDDEGTAGIKRWLGEMRSWVKEHCQ